MVKSAYKNDVTEVARLALSGADVNVVDNATNMTGLGFATENGNRDMINVLLSAGAGPNVKWCVYRSMRGPTLRSKIKMAKPRWAWRASMTRQR